MNLRELRFWNKHLGWNMEKEYTVNNYNWENFSKIYWGIWQPLGIYSLFITFNLDVFSTTYWYSLFRFNLSGEIVRVILWKTVCVENATRHSFVLVPPANKAQTPFVSQPFHEFEKNCQNNQNSLSCVEKVLKTR